MFWPQIESYAQAQSILEQEIKAGRYGHAYLFIGPGGDAKRSFAMAFARYILNDREDRVGRKLHPDFHLLQSEKRTIGVSEVRLLQTDIYLTSTASHGKIVFIDEAEKLTVSAQNALLKNLEEPPSGTVFMLLAMDLTDLLPTVISRCRLLRLPPLSKTDFIRQCCSHLSPEEQGLMYILADGEEGQAALWQDSDSLSGVRRSIESFFKALWQGNRIMAAKIVEKEERPEVFFIALLSVFRAAARNLECEVLGDVFTSLKTDYADCLHALPYILYKAIADIEKHVNKQLVIETLIIEMTEVFGLC